MGRSLPGASLDIITAATFPAPPSSVASSDVTRNSANLMWHAPSWDGGAPVGHYEVQLFPKSPAALVGGLVADWVPVFQVRSALPIIVTSATCDNHLDQLSRLPLTLPSAPSCASPRAAAATGLACAGRRHQVLPLRPARRLHLPHTRALFQRRRCQRVQHGCGIHHMPGAARAAAAAHDHRRRAGGLQQLHRTLVALAHPRSPALPLKTRRVCPPALQTSVQLTWRPPAFDGGAAIKAYTLEMAVEGEDGFSWAPAYRFAPVQGLLGFPQTEWQLAFSPVDR